jgi:ankyrin repeat protein
MSSLSRSAISRRTVITVLALCWVGVVSSCYRNEAGSREIRDAAWNGDLAKVQVLLKRHPDLASSKSSKGGTPLHWAAAGGHKDVAELLLANGADVDAKDDNGVTPLYTAATKGYKGVAELLLANGADVNAKTHRGYTPLHTAASHNQKEMAALLLAKGANVNAISEQGVTPLRIANRKGYKEIEELLRQHGGFQLPASLPEWPYP